MEIIFHGVHEVEDVGESLVSVLNLFKERYQVTSFREVRLTMTLVDDQGDDVELIDSETAQAYRVVEVSQDGYELTQKNNHPNLKLVVDNTRKNPV